MIAIVCAVLLAISVATQPISDASSEIVTGRATWYGARGMIAAAGPGLRQALGPGWRGRAVLVRAGDRSIVVRLTDWCACFGRNPAKERIIDLSDDAFAKLAPLSAGVIVVSVQDAPGLPATDR